jgi:isochorismate synthase
VADLLKYRIPNEPAIKQTGAFFELDSLLEADGFVMTDFNQTRIFGFKPNEEEGTISFSSEVPFVIDEPTYLAQAADFISEIEAQKLSKAVFSRIKAIDFDGEKVLDLFNKLCEAYPSAFVYFVSSELFGTWVGATPETLLEVNVSNFKTMSLAGTKKASDETPWREKETMEQAYVTNFILNEIQKVENVEVAVNGPYTYVAGPVKHLRTDFHFSSETINGLKLAKSLHPTPAVSGLPRAEALKLIASHEQHDRGFYTGCIGWTINNKSSLYVNLRCCQLQAHKTYLYLGGGFTIDSKPNEEWEETENKSKTLLNILQNL